MCVCVWIHRRGPQAILPIGNQSHVTSHSEEGLFTMHPREQPLATPNSHESDQWNCTWVWVYHRAICIESLLFWQANIYHRGCCSSFTKAMLFLPLLHGDRSHLHELEGEIWTLVSSFIVFLWGWDAVKIGVNKMREAFVHIVTWYDLYTLMHGIPWRLYKRYSVCSSYPKHINLAGNLIRLRKDIRKEVSRY